MTQNQINDLVKLVTENGVIFEVGLTEIELDKIQALFNVKFPPDLSQFLATALPISENFIHWRKGLLSKQTEAAIKERIEWPFEGMVFDIEQNNFWIENWGEKPSSPKERRRVARQYFDAYPRLIPIYSHRYIPSEPHETGNPVFSIHQMDIIYYGYDLPTYLANEFHFDLPANIEIATAPRRKIEFWSECI